MENVTLAQMHFLQCFQTSFGTERLNALFFKEKCSPHFSFRLVQKKMVLARKNKLDRIQEINVDIRYKYTVNDQITLKVK